MCWWNLKFFFNWGHFFSNWGQWGQMCLWNLLKMFFNWGHFFTIGGNFFKLVAKNYFGIEKISHFGNYMDPCINQVLQSNPLEIDS